jgi:hypothetical protein
MKIKWPIDSIHKIYMNIKISYLKKKGGNFTQLEVGHHGQSRPSMG